MSWQICEECKGCPATPRHKKECIERYKKHELEMIEDQLKREEFEPDDLLW